MNWKQSFTLGLLAPGVWDGKGEPVAYLYNGVRLPGLPETEYEYAVIYYDSATGKYVLVVSSETLTEGTLLGWNIPVPTVYYKAEDNNWVYESGPTTTAGLITDDPIWSNADLIKDGSVYLEASEPVEVS